MKKKIKVPCFIRTPVKAVLARGRLLTASKLRDCKKGHLTYQYQPQKRQRFSSFEQENLHSVPRSAWLKLLDPHPPPPSKLGQWVESSGEKESLVCMTVGSLYQSETQCLEGETEARIFRRILLAEQPSRTGVSSSDRNSFIKVDQMILCHSC